MLYLLLIRLTALEVAQLGREVCDGVVATGNTEAWGAWIVQLGIVGVSIILLHTHFAGSAIIGSVIKPSVIGTGATELGHLVPNQDGGFMVN